MTSRISSAITGVAVDKHCPILLLAKKIIMHHNKCHIL
jgi:hypothetical protein